MTMADVFWEWSLISERGEERRAAAESYEGLKITSQGSSNGRSLHKRGWHQNPAKSCLKSMLLYIMTPDLYEMIGSNIF